MVEAAALIRRARTEAGVSQTELARRLGTTQSAIARLESRGSNPRIETVERALRVLGRSLRLEAAELAYTWDPPRFRERLRLTPRERLESMAAAARNTAPLVGSANPDPSYRLPEEARRFDPVGMLRNLAVEGLEFVVIGGVAAALRGSLHIFHTLDVAVPRGAKGPDEGFSLRVARLPKPSYGPIRARSDLMNVGDVDVRVAALEDLIRLRRREDSPAAKAWLYELEEIARVTAEDRDGS